MPRGSSTSVPDWWLGILIDRIRARGQQAELARAYAKETDCTINAANARVSRFVNGHVRTREFAEWISRQLGLPSFEFRAESKEEWAGFDTVVRAHRQGSDKAQELLGRLLRELVPDEDPRDIVAPLLRELALHPKRPRTKRPD